MHIPKKKQLLKLIKISYGDKNKCKFKKNVKNRSFDIFLYKKNGFLYSVNIKVPPAVDTIEKFLEFKQKIVPLMINSMKSQVNKYGTQGYIDVAKKNQLTAQSFGDYLNQNPELTGTIKFPLS